MAKTNDEGMTWAEWYNAALFGVRPLTQQDAAAVRSGWQLMRREWREGVDPTEWAAALGTARANGYGLGRVFASGPKKTARESMTLAELLARANSHYPDGGLGEHYDPKTGEPHASESTGDGLALFVVREIADTFDPLADGDAQLEDARRAVHRAENELGAIDAGMQMERNREYVACCLCGRWLPVEDTYSPGDEALCPECDTEVTGRTHNEEKAP